MNDLTEASVYPLEKWRYLLGGIVVNEVMHVKNLVRTINIARK